MTINYFEKQPTHSMFTYPLLVSVIWLSGIFAPGFEVQFSEPLMPLTAGLNFLIQNQSILCAIMLPVILFQSFYLNQLLIKQEVLNTATFFPGFIYALFLSAALRIENSVAVIMSELFLVLAIEQLLMSHRKDKAFKQIFNAGFFISIAAFFYVQSLLFALVLLFGLIIIRPFIWREWVVYTFGLVTPALFIFTYYWWYDSLLMMQNLYKGFHRFEMFKLNFSLYETLAYAAFLFLVVLGLTRLFRGKTFGSVRGRNNLMVLYSIFFVLILFSFFITIQSATVLVAGIPITVIIANYLLSIKRTGFANFMIVLLLTGIVLIRLNEYKII